MRRKKRSPVREAPKKNVGFLVTDQAYETLCVPGYTSLDRNPEIMTACSKIAELIASMTIHLMSNTEQGDIRIINELSRMIDIEPEHNMTRYQWMQSIVMTMLLYGHGNAVVVPHTHNGLLMSLEPISASRVSFLPIGYRDYRVLIDGRERDPAGVLHFRHNPDPVYLWKGRGLQVSLRDVANNLKQASATEKGFLESKWKPSIVVKVDGMVEEFSSKEGRKKLLEQYIESSEAGEPWLIPAEQFQVEQIRPLSLADLAIKDTIELDKRMVAAVVGVPPFVLGVGEYSRDAWNSFIQNTVRPIVIGLQQELTKKLIISPNWYLRFNVLSLMDWDINTIYSVFSGMADKGFATGNEVRDRLGMSPKDGLDDLRILENYIPVDMIGDQKKLVQGGE